MVRTIAVAMQVWNEQTFIELCIRGLYDLPIDFVYLCDGRCIDRTIEIAQQLLKNIKCPFKIQQIEEPHDEYFLRHNLEPNTFNSWHTQLKDYDWILHLDVDEIFSPDFLKLLYYIKNKDEVKYNGVYFQKLEIVGSPEQMLWHLHENDFDCPIPNHPYHPIRNNLQNRLYKISDWFYPSFENKDTFPVSKCHNATFSKDVKILHIKRLLGNGRTCHGSSKHTPEDDPWCHPNNTYVPVPRELIPDRLMEFYHSTVRGHQNGT